MLAKVVKETEKRRTTELLEGITKNKYTYEIKYSGHIQRREDGHVLQKA